MRPSKKRGSLALSINAIVILILAITMLGLGLTFIRGLFTSAETKISEIADAAELANPPTRDNVLTIFPNQLEFRKSKSARVEVAYLNTDEEGEQCRLESLEPQSNPIIDIIIAQYPQSEIKMKKDGIAVWTMVLDDKNVGSTDETELFTLTLNCWDSRTTPSARGLTPLNPLPDRSSSKDILITVKP